MDNGGLKLIVDMTSVRLYSETTSFEDGFVYGVLVCFYSMDKLRFARVLLYLQFGYGGLTGIAVALGYACLCIFEGGQRRQDDICSILIRYGESSD